MFFRSQSTQTQLPSKLLTQNRSSTTLTAAADRQLPDFSNKIILIIAAASDPIASSIAIRLSKLGAQLILVDCPEAKERLTQLASNCDAAALHGTKWQFRSNKWQRAQKATVFTLNPEDSSVGLSIKVMIKNIADMFGARLDALIFKSANIESKEELLNNTKSLMQNLEQTLNSELMLFVRIVQAVVPLLEQTQGTIINLSTMDALKPVSIEETYLCKCNPKSILESQTTSLVLVSKRNRYVH